MTANSSVKRWNAILSAVLRTVLVVFILAVVAGLKIPVVSDEKGSLIALIHIGVAVSLASNWRFIIGLNWKDPINIIGSVLGAASVLVIISAFKDVSLMPVSGYKAAFYVLAALLLLKVGLKIVQNRKNRIPRAET